MKATIPTLKVRQLGLTDFSSTCLAMQQFTANRTENTADEIWLTQHYPVYSCGLNRKNLTLPIDTNIPIIYTDRGGKITYHATGQIILYLLLDLTRYQLNVRQLVSLLEDAVISLLASYHIQAQSKKEAPGVYVDHAKIAALGLRLKNTYCYHGLSLNVQMDLAPFLQIDPCGYVGLKVTQMVDLGINATVEIIENQLLALVQSRLVATRVAD